MYLNFKKKTYMTFLHAVVTFHEYHVEGTSRWPMLDRKPLATFRSNHLLPLIRWSRYVMSSFFQWTTFGQLDSQQSPKLNYLVPYKTLGVRKDDLLLTPFQLEFQYLWTYAWLLGQLQPSTWRILDHKTTQIWWMVNMEYKCLKSRLLCCCFWCLYPYKCTSLIILNK